MSAVRHIGSARHPEPAHRTTASAATSGAADGEFGTVMDAALAAAPRADPNAAKDGEEGKQDGQHTFHAETQAAADPAALAAGALSKPIVAQVVALGASTLAKPVAAQIAATPAGAGLSPHAAHHKGKKSDAGGDLNNNGTGALGASSPTAAQPVLAVTLAATDSAMADARAAYLATPFGGAASPGKGHADAPVTAAPAATPRAAAVQPDSRSSAASPARSRANASALLNDLTADATDDTTASGTAGTSDSGGGQLAMAFAAADQALASAQDAGTAGGDPSGATAVGITVAADLAPAGATSSGGGAALDSRIAPQIAAATPVAVALAQVFTVSSDGGDPVGGTRTGLQAVNDISGVSAAYNAIGAAPDPAPAGTVAAAGATAALSPSDPASLADGIAHQILSMIGTGRQEATLQLQPPDLGALTVRIAVSGHEVSAWFGSPQSQVQQALSQGIGQLRGDLAGAGLNLANAWVGSDASSARQPLGQPVVQRRDGIAAAASSATTGTASPTPRASGVSIYV